MEPITELSRPWAALSSDMVREISIRLRDAADFVRLHAVCIPWRESAPCPAAIRPTRFLPWPLALCEDLLVHVPLNFGRRLSSWPYHHGCGILLPRASSSSGDNNWVARADGTAAWFLTVHPEPTMTDLVTGAIRVLPRFRENDDGRINRRMEKCSGIVYSDGTIFVYSDSGDFRTANFTAAILRPGDAAWTIAEKSVYFGERCHHSSAAYHDGKILVCMNLQFWFVLMPDFEGNGAAGGGRLEMKSGTSTSARDAVKHEGSYIFESGNELIWATVISKRKPTFGYTGYDLASTPSVTLHALVEANISGRMRLVPRDGQSFRDRVLFLGSPASFTTKATTQFGGCAYFVFNSCVYKYNLINGVAQLMEHVPAGWGSDMSHVWIQPRPAIDPIDKIREKLKAPTKE
ncbi:hypothetical protein ACQ4PT_039119 [Festuca glaucescens]